MKQILLTFLIFLTSSQIFGQTELRQELENIIATKNATIGISIKNIETKDTLNINGTLNTPLMSIFKFHIALATLNLVDKGKLSLKQKIFIKKKNYTKILGVQYETNI